MCIPTKKEDLPPNQVVGLLCGGRQISIISQIELNVEFCESFDVSGHRCLVNYVSSALLHALLYRFYEKCRLPVVAIWVL